MTIADLHIHSRFSRATSPSLTPACLERWARIKGIQLLGSGDATHPLWLSELREQLDDAEEGLYFLKESARAAFEKGPALAGGLPFPAARQALSSAVAGDAPRFVLSGEISTIYKKDGKTRKVHHLVLFPDFEAARRFQGALERLGNIRSDGRPILGVDSAALLALLLDTDERSVLIPAHIWTPWFSVLGARSGFDSIEECYGDYTPFIPAIETGLSSNPPMNWAVPHLDGFSIISNSDAHSPEKLGREATILDMELSFRGLKDALRLENSRVRGTVEFFPQEGKYHYDGHRKCAVYMNDGTLICPVCGKPLTRGVMGRVLELAGRPVDEAASCPAGNGGAESRRDNMNPYYSLVPLRELLGEILRLGPSSKKVTALYGDLIEKAGGELSILMDADPGELGRVKGLSVSGELLAEAITLMRLGTVSIQPGYDGEYGVVRVFGGRKNLSSGTDRELFPHDFGRGAEAALHAANQAEAFSQAASVMRQTAVATHPDAVATHLAASVMRQDAVATHPTAAVMRQTAAAKPQTAVMRQNAVATHPTAAVMRQTAATYPEAVMRQTAAAFAPDETQRAIIEAKDPRALIIAGPGTGKTAVLSERIKRLIREGVPPGAILALSFTVRAAAELRDRVRMNAGAPYASGGSGGVFAATFHSLAAFVLRNEAGEAGLPGDFSVMGEDERDVLLGEICGAQADRGAGKTSARKLGAYIESRKRYLLLPGETRPPFDGADSAFLAPLTAPDPAMEALYAGYRTRLRAMSCLDYDDLIMGLARLFLGRPNVLARYREKFPFIFVDEYQDLNFAQYVLIRLLAPGRGAEASLWVIGDPDQAIYGFRGSDKRFIDRFLQDYPDAGRFELTRSFRCALPLVKAARALTGREMTGSGGAVELFRFSYATDSSEAEGIARRIAGLIGGASFFALDSSAAGEGEAAPEDCAILFRAGVMAAPFVAALENHGIPYEYKDNAGGGEELPLSLPPAKGVSLMTMHASKGLEFDYVFVPGLEEGIVPFTLYSDEDQIENQIEEEKRLLYVAMTRARRGLYLSWAGTRNFRGRILKGRPSRFLSGLEELVPIVKSGGGKKRGAQMELF